MAEARTLLVSVVLIAVEIALNLSNVEGERLTMNLGPCVLDISDPCSSGKILFYFYTRDSQNVSVMLTTNDTSLPLGYKPTSETKVLIHGYGGSVNFKEIVDVRTAYQKNGQFNIIVVDWSVLVKEPCYLTAVANSVKTGKCIALLLANLERLNSAGVGKFHVVGHSLGAHVGSFAGNEFQRLQGRQLGRITGLDPALPLYDNMLDNSGKLDKEDADFVDVIHTNVGYGKLEPSGHVDFYVNDGVLQPACRGALNAPRCSHIMVLTYFAESIAASDDHGFWGVPCCNYGRPFTGHCEPGDSSPNRALMGENCDKNARGTYFVRTNDKPPYAMGWIWGTRARTTN